MIFRDILPNGLRIITAPMPHVYSVTASIWVATGSRYEQESLNGVSHFLEHMLFKGTTNRTAKQIVEAMESVGGMMNAFTSKEHTCYYTKSLSEDLNLSMELLADMFLNSTFLPEEFAKEKNVILEEINMYEDSPEDVAQELFDHIIWPQNSYGWPIIGNLQTVGDLSREELYQYYKTVYVPEHTIIVVAGNVTRQQVLEQVNRYFSSFAGNRKPLLAAVPQPGVGQSFVFKDIEQMHLCLGFPGVAIDDDDLYKAMLLANALGGGASSRLFQAAREERGLTYSIYAYHNSYTQAGEFFCYAATTAAKMKEVVSVIGEQMSHVLQKGFAEEEIERSKQQLKGSLLMSMENSSSVMSRLGKSELSYGKIITVEETVKKLLAVTLEDVNAMAKKLFRKDKLVLSSVGAKEVAIRLEEIF